MEKSTEKVLLEPDPQIGPPLSLPPICTSVRRSEIPTSKSEIEICRKPVLQHNKKRKRLEFVNEHPLENVKKKQKFEITEYPNNPRKFIPFDTYKLQNKTQKKCGKYNNGHWTAEEHEKFLEGLRVCGYGKWREISEK